MTVKELIVKLQKLDGDLYIMIPYQKHSEYYEPATWARVKYMSKDGQVVYKEDYEEGEEPEGNGPVLVIS